MSATDQDDRFRPELAHLAQDSLGEVGGFTILPYASEAREIVESWRVKSIGRRPIDYVGRDLLFGPLYGDGRTWKFSKILKNKPAWMLQDIRHFPAKQQQVILQMRTLHYLQLITYLELREGSSDDEEQILDRLIACWPFGAEVEWRGEGERTPRHVCDLARYCPFCLTRSVTELYRRIELGPWSAQDDKIFLLGRVSITDEQLDNLDPPPSNEIRPRWVRDYVGSRLKKFASSVGADGGLLTYQIGPHLAQHPVWQNDERGFIAQAGLRYDVVILGQVVTGHARLRDAIESGIFRDVSAALGEILSEAEVSVRWRIPHGSHTGLLREVLIGVVPRASGPHARAGLRGAFTHLPWHLGNRRQWQTYLAAAKGIHLYDAWGSWHGVLPHIEVRPRGNSNFVNAPQRRGRYRQRLALQQINAQRQGAAASRQAALLDELRQLLGALPQSAPGVLGRQRIEQIFVGTGRTISQRDARWLAGNYRDLVHPMTGGSDESEGTNSD